MAMTCINGSRECCGCMACQGPRAGSVLGDCAKCGEPVLTMEDRYEFPDGEIVHEDCALEFIRDNYHIRGG